MLGGSTANLVERSGVALSSLNRVSYSSFDLMFCMTN
jgi:hypothetical protein